MDMTARIGFFNGFSGTPARDADRRGAAQKATTPERVVMELEPYRVASLHARGPVTITCLSGQLWITTPGELEDVILAAGQSRVMQSPVSDVLLSTAGARNPATFSLRAATAESSAAPIRVEFA